MDSKLDKLAKNRDAILVAEIGTYLHLIGRYCEEFIAAQAKDINSDYEYTKICYRDDFFENTGLKAILENPDWGKRINDSEGLRNINNIKQHLINNYCDFIKKHTWGNKPKGLLKCLADAHGVVSSVDKALAGNIDFEKQNRDNTFQSTAFGWEKKILFNNQVKKIFLLELGVTLNNIAKTKFQDDEQDFNLYNHFLGVLKKYYPMTVGETRRPINEISLWDYARTIASFMKPNLARVILDGWYEPKGKSKWRILKVNLDILGLLSKGIKIGDVLGYKGQVEDFYDRVKWLVEYKYPLGNEIYRDATGIYFSFPFLKEETSTRVKEKLFKKIENQIMDNRKGVELVLDFMPDIDVTEASRSVTRLGNEVQAARESSFLHCFNIDKLKECKNDIKNSGKAYDVCPVCRIRFKERAKDKCKVCRKRYERRVKEFLKDSQKTIWIDEVADKNDYVALLVGKFDLDSWLSGELVNTLVSATFDDWKKKLKDDLIQKFSLSSVGALKVQLEKMFNDSLDEDQIKLCQSLFYVKNKKSFKFENDFWKPLAERDATGLAIKATSNSEKAEWLVKLLFRKHPTAARMRRIWTTTLEFFRETILGEIIPGYFDLHSSEVRRKRIEVSIDGKLKPNRSYQVNTGEKVLDFFAVGDGSRLISISNLELVANSLDIIKEKLLKNFKVWDEKDKQWRRKKVKCDWAGTGYLNYNPWIDIYSYPEEFMVLLPARDCFEIAGQVINSYEKQFSKVRDRLPLHLGMVFFPRKTPLYVAFDAGKRILDSFPTAANHGDRFPSASHRANGNYEATIKYVNTNENNTVSLNLELEEEKFNGKELKWLIDCGTGDPKVEDRWYPYLRVTNEVDISRRQWKIEDPACVHVKELEQGDQVKLFLSYFTYIFLDSNAKRFEAGDDPILLDDFKTIKDIWKSVNEMARNGIMSDTKLRNIHTLLCTKREEWNDDANIYEKFVTSVLEKELGPSHAAAFKTYVTGQERLFDKTMELYFKIFKERLEMPR